MFVEIEDENLAARSQNAVSFRDRDLRVLGVMEGLGEDREIDGFVAPRAPAIPREDFNNIGWLFDDPQEAATQYYRKSKIFPIMHVVGVRRELVERHAWLPNALFKAFSASKDLAISRLEEMSACKITMPFVDERLQQDRVLMGPDFWPYGIEQNRAAISMLIQFSYEQNLIDHMLNVDELFPDSTGESYKI